MIRHCKKHLGWVPEEYGFYGPCTESTGALKDEDRCEIVEVRGVYDKVMALSDEKNRYKKALEDILKHMEMVVGPMMDISFVFAIAKKALQDEKNKK